MSSGPNPRGQEPPVDVGAARAFVATHGRLLDRRRLALLVDGGSPDGVLAALDGHRNADGGYGWGLEPDLRAPGSQPVAAMHALEVLAEVAPRAVSVAAALCDWLAARTLPDGGLPIALPVDDPAGCAPLWSGADPTTSSLQMTAQVAANAHLVADHDPAVARHPWLGRATSHCLAAIRALDATAAAHEVGFALGLLDAAAPRLAEDGVDVDELVAHVGRLVPPSGILPVAGGAEGEALHPLDLSPVPGRPSARAFAPGVLAADRQRLAAAQQPDGGWPVDFESWSPAAALEWRAYATVGAVKVLLTAPPA